MTESLAQEVWTSVDSYLASGLLGHDAELDACIAASKAGGLPEIQVSPLHGKLLFLLARAMGARRILELGTLGGYSTISLARAVSPGGRVVTCEIDPHHASVAQASISLAGLDNIVSIRVGSALDTLAALQDEAGDPFDFIFIDADKSNMPEYFQRAMRLSRAGTMIVFDNVVRDGEVANSSSDDASVVGVRRLFDMLSADPRVDATAIQTVGVKGYDGLAFAVVNA